MKKLLSKFICILLVLTTCFSLVACKSCKDEEEKPVDNGVVDSAVLTLNALTTAQTDALDSSKNLMLAENGSSNYKIVISENAKKGELFASQDLVRFVKESLGVTLKVVYDNEVVLNDLNQYYISIGKNKLLEEHSKTDETLVPKYDEIKENGQLIANRGNIVFITGYNTSGTYSAMVTFIEKELNFEQFAADEYHIDKLDKQVIYSFGTFKYLPNVQFNLVSEGSGSDDTVQERFRQRMVGENNVGGQGISGAILGSYSHTLGTQVLNNSDRDLFPDGKHLCMTNPRAPIALAEDINKKVQGLSKGADDIIYEIGSADDFGRCKCSDCELYYKTHIDSEGYLKVLNGAAKLVRENMINRGMGDTVVYLMGLCYNLYEYPPTKYNEITETYEKLNEDVYVDDWVMIRYTPIGACHGHAWNDPRCESNNTTAIHNANGWASLTDNLSLWTYGYIFHGQGAALVFPNFQSYSYLADYFNEHPYTLTRVQASKDEKDRPFSELKDYLIGKLWYDNEYDYTTLYEKFFSVYYGVAAPYMKNYLDLTMANFHAISERKGYNDCIDSWFGNFIYDDKGDWGFDVIMALQACIDDAYDAINNSGLDEATKAKLRDRVCSDSIMHRHFLIADCEAYFSKVEFAQMRAEYIADCNRFGMTVRA